MNQLEKVKKDIKLRLKSDGLMRAIAGVLGFCVGFVWWMIFYLIGNLMWPAGGQMPGTLIGFLYLYVLMYGGALVLAYLVFRGIHSVLYVQFVAPPLPPPSDEEGTTDEEDE